VKNHEQIEFAEPVHGMHAIEALVSNLFGSQF